MQDGPLQNPEIPTSAAAADGADTAAHADADADEASRARAEYAAYEEERRLRLQRRDRISRRIVAIIMAGALTVLAYDSTRTALDARRNGGSWGYPAALAALCAAAVLIGCCAAVSRAVARRRSARA